MKKIITISLTTISLYANSGESIFATREQMSPHNYMNSNLAINPSQNANSLTPMQLEELRQSAQNDIAKADERLNNIHLEQQRSNNYNSYSSYNSSSGSISEEELALMKSAIRSQNLKALQQRFHSKKYTGVENTTTINYIENKTQKIRTRFAMATTLIFETDIESYILGDTTGFKVEEIPNMSNAVAIKPLLIGIDTSLTVRTKDKKLHTFYLFSTDYKNAKDPALVVYITDKESRKILEEKQAQIEKDYFIIKDGMAELRVKREDISAKYIQKATKENQWLMAEEIFSDKKFTYFKYDKDNMPQLPTIYAVIDGKDSPVETRIIGNYLIAETINPKFSIITGESYVCVEKTDAQEILDQRQIKTEVHISKDGYKAPKDNNNKAIDKLQGNL
ncbi:type IV secretion system, translocation pore protein VirB9 [Campylobacter vicugnae]|uniref:Type IV secretion system, translocation pore protein VirB9 n=1 Tax=Campylobacter vicugnae TaxID=1660076 RepID=A0A1X9T0Q2_9BACT|nr:TrbG/VirB9 family P-type conjugative transfer protein [Campylobacter sp. RM8964]ARR02080.1 type IV secretion system, translocation pore protein VirB9 [Campylobacter sp. RM8964]